MEATEYLIKLTKLLKKIGEGYYVVSNDPDCDCDFGVDIDGNLIICGERSILKLCELETMKYRYHYDYEQDEADYHLHFIFLNNIDLYLYGNPSEGFYNEKHLIYKGRSMYNTGVNDILYASS